MMSDWRMMDEISPRPGLTATSASRLEKEVSRLRQGFITLESRWSGNSSSKPRFIAKNLVIAVR